MKEKKAQALIISIWILIFLTVISISLGHRVSLTLRLRKYQKNKLQSFYLAKAALLNSLTELAKDPTPEADTLADTWAKKETFNQITFTAINGGTALAEVEDEERKININTAPKELLLALFNHYKVDNPGVITDNILTWRGDKDAMISPESEVYAAFGYECKKEALSIPEELLLIKEMSSETYRLIKPMVTVFGSGKINLNTASETILRILGKAAAYSLNNPEISDDDILRLSSKIISLRKEGKFFSQNEITLEDLRTKLNLGDVESDDCTKLLEALIQWDILTGISDSFTIVAKGKVQQTSEITAVFSRNNNDFKTSYWHEN